MRLQRDFLGGLAALLLAFSGSAARADEPPTVRFSALGTVDAWRVDHGAVKDGDLLVAVGQLGLELDLERILGARRLTASATGLVSNRRSVSSELVDDLHGVDNREIPKRTALYEAWVRQALPQGYVKAGLVDLNTEFGVNTAGGLFINGAQGLGLDLGQLGWGGPSTYPESKAGAVAAWEGPITLKAGLFAGQRGAHRVSRARPTLAVVEAAHQGSGWRATLGAWRHSRHYGGLYEEFDRRAGTGGYGLLEAERQMGRGRRLDGFLRVGFADRRADAVASEVSAGLVLHRPLLGLEGEAAGIGLLRAEMGDVARRLPFDEPLARHETVIEATYRVPVGAGMAVQPNLQYIVNPGAIAGRRDALVIGIRLDGAWSRDF